MSNQERDNQIIDLHKRDIPLSEAAKRFNLSKSRIAVIEQEQRERVASADRAAAMSARLREADDPERVWPVSDLMDALQLWVRFDSAIRRHFKDLGQSELSFRELISLSISSTDGIAALFRINGIGSYGVRDFIRALNRMALGPRCKVEVERICSGNR